MNTFYQLWGVKTPAEAMAKIEEQRAASGVTEPRNLEEQALSLVGRDVYEALIKEYTEKQWGRKCTELPTSVIKRLPVRFTFDNNYFNDLFQGIPVGGYTGLVKAMLEGIEVRLDMDFLKCRSELESLAKKIVYTGPIDEFFSFRLGTLEYRSLRFETELLDCTNFQGNAVVNYIDASVPYTRIIEHKHFEFGEQPKTVITREYPMTWEPGKERFYTVNDEKNSRLYQEYVALSKQLPNVIFGGRLAEYKYYDMDDVIERAMDVFSRE